MTNEKVRQKLKEIPTTPGVYRFYDIAGTILYIGKAKNIRHRVPSYFLRSNLDRGPRIAQLIDNITDIGWTVTDSEIEALLLESRLIQQHKPKYNVGWRDDKSYLHVEIDLKADFPTIRLVRKGDVGQNKKALYFGPYTSPRALRLAMKFIRRMLPYCEYSFSKGHKANSKWQMANSRTEAGSSAASRDSLVASNWASKPCLYYHLGLCPGICAGEMSIEDYRRRVRQIAYFFQGKKDRVIAELEREMKKMSKLQRYEQAELIRRSWSGLQHLKDISLMRGAFEEKSIALRGAVPHRIEAYDVSNIFGRYAVGSMVVFIDGQPAKQEYKKFKIKTVSGISDVGALVEVLRRRLRHSEIANSKLKIANSRAESASASRNSPSASRPDSWPLPNLIMIDGGKGQLNSAVKVLTEFGLQIPVLAVAKGRERKKADQYYYGYGKELLQNDGIVRRIRDEAHRFAINYYRQVHRKQSLLS